MEDAIGAMVGQSHQAEAVDSAAFTQRGFAYSKYYGVVRSPRFRFGRPAIDKAVLSLQPAWSVAPRRIAMSYCVPHSMPAFRASAECFGRRVQSVIFAGEAANSGRFVAFPSLTG